MARRRRMLRNYQGNPLSSNQKWAIAGVGAVLVGLVGYYLYEQSQSSSSASTSSGGGGSSGATNSTTLGSGGSTTALPQTSFEQSTTLDSYDTNYNSMPQTG